jgi:hypothetical protein
LISHLQMVVRARNKGTAGVRASRRTGAGGAAKVAEASPRWIWQVRGQRNKNSWGCGCVNAGPPTASRGILRPRRVRRERSFVAAAIHRIWVFL